METAGLVDFGLMAAPHKEVVQMLTQTQQELEALGVPDSYQLDKGSLA